MFFHKLKLYSGVILFTLSATVSVHAAQEDIIGSETCSSCHDDEYEVWQNTTHAKSEDFSEQEKAPDIAKAMGVEDLDEENTCWGCHLLNIVTEESTEGVSCESCHGAAKAWAVIHNCFGGNTLEECKELVENESDIKKSAETPDHKTWRLSERLKYGMLPPDDLYALASNCLTCHTVPNEQLVNKGKHTAGSKFELVSWSQGEVRHNFLSGKGNLVAKPETKRLMYVIGRALDLEFSLRGLAKAKTEGDFSKAMADRVKNAVSKLQEIDAKKAMKQVKDMITAQKGVKLVANNADEISAAADKVSTAAQAFEKAFRKAGGLSAIDGLIPKKTQGDAQ